MSTQPTSNDRHDRRELLDTPGCARYIASSVRHVRRMIAERTIPHYKVGHSCASTPTRSMTGCDVIAVDRTTIAPLPDACGGVRRLVTDAFAQASSSSGARGR